MNKISKLRLFLFISFTISCTFFALNYWMKGKLFSASILDYENQFADFFWFIRATINPEDAYKEYGVLFPPLALCMYYCLGHIVNMPAETLEGSLQEMMLNKNLLTIFLGYNLVLVVLLFYCISEILKKYTYKTIVLLPISLLISFPFCGSSLQRGNAVALVALLVTLAWAWMDAESYLKRELALILIAVATGFKMYPAILGLIYIKKREWRKVFRLFIYCVVALFAPFIFFGGIDGVLAWCKNLFSFGQSIRSGWYTVEGATRELLHLLKFEENAILIVGKIGPLAFLVLNIVCTFCSRYKWQQSMFIAAIMASFLSSGWMYTCVYYLPVVLLLLEEKIEKENEDTKAITVLELFSIVCLACIFSMPFIWEKGIGIYNGIYITSYVMLGINSIYCLSGLCNKRKAID